MKRQAYFAFVLLLFIQVSFGQVIGSGLSYHGRLLKSDGTAVNSSAVQFQVQIRSSGNENCLLFSEIQTKDLSTSDGLFSLTLNDGSGVRNDSSSLTVPQVLANQGTKTLPGGACVVGTTYTPTSTDGRRFKVYFNDGSFSGWEPFPDEAINFVPLAIEAQQIAGYKATNIIRGPVTSSVAELTAPQLAEFLNIVNGTSTQYMNSSTVASVAIPSYSTASPPTTPVAGSFWYDSTSKQLKFYDGTSTNTVGNTSTLPASSITTGTLATARLGSGSATASTFLRGDNTWATPPAGQWTTTGSDIYYSTGKVGIGTATPGQALDVVGAIKIENGSYNSTISVPSTDGFLAGNGNSGGFASILLGSGNTSGGGAAVVWVGTNNTSNGGGWDNSVTLGKSNSVTSNTVTVGVGISNTVVGSMQMGPSNTAKMTILSAGNVGVGTASPGAKIHSVDINATAYTSTLIPAGQLILENNQTSADNAVASMAFKVGGTSGQAATAISAVHISGEASAELSFQTTSESFGVKEVMRLDKLGRLGVGTSTPAGPLDIQGGNAGVGAAGIINIIGQKGGVSNSGGAINITAGAGGNMTATNGGNIILNPGAKNSTGSDGNVILANLQGNVGIGTTSPASKLHIVSANTSYGSQMFHTAPGGSYGYGIYSFENGGGSNNVGVFGESTANGIGIYGWADGQNGYSGIGVVGESAGTSSGIGVRGIANGSANIGYAVQAINSSASGWGIYASGTSPNYFAGNVGIGTTAPQTTLQVAGIISPATNNTYTLGSATYRFTEVYATNGVINTSDRREKKDIYNTDLGLDFINKLRPVSYRWRTGVDKDVHYGLIAQEAEQVIADVGKSEKTSIVTHDEATDRYGVRYSELISPLIKAAQELYNKLVGVEAHQGTQDRDIASMKADYDQLKANDEVKAKEIEKLKQENSAIKARLDKIEKVLGSK